MQKTLQKKFVITAMAAISVLLLILLGAINGLNFWQTDRQTDRLLETLTRQAAAAPRSEPGMLPFPDMSGKREPGDFFSPPVTEDHAMSARYFCVWFDREGSVARTDIGRISSVSGEEAKEYAEKIYEQGKESGRLNRFEYRRMPARDGQGELLLFLDTSAQRYALLLVLALSAGIGILCWFGMLLLVILLSNKAILPIARNLEKQKQFVTDAGHEIKTPLAIIMANTEAMELCGGETKWSRNIKAQTARLGGLMQNLLVLARLDEGVWELPASDFSMSRLLEEALPTFCESAALKNVMIEAKIGQGIELHSNRENLLRLVSILLDNAVKYVPKGGEIAVTLKRQGRETLLQVENDCEELPVDEPEKLFDRFYRGDSARTQKSGGYGIGLSAAQAIVENCKGEIRAEYRGDSRIVFTVRI
ncbi:HAMP domain-containing sensor histidine kinase [Schaedlerella sp.]|jgi:two-component system sensor histidine kinase CiaH|uniref:sensor histidine kinase n=1 Tax=Schaedlerella sp. TaxID=2676057 RepID=UPI002629C93F|nr:HAMP domain-containing sensor histidine kinase [uncultured Schaedlerella sp.]MCI8767809.1 HAMP domain-containing histidine kinase [Ruminococcus sp.]